MSAQPDQQVDSAVETPIEREIDHDEYDPIGTAVLIVIYFLILVALWFFTYFVEFLGNDPTVIGSLAPVIVA